MKARDRIWPCLLLWTLGCGDELKTVFRVEEPRVLGARVEVEGDPERASPAPGESARVTWLVAAPDGEAAAGAALAACSAVQGIRGLPECREAPFVTSSSDAAGPRPSFAFGVPEGLDAEAYPLLLISGSLCANGAGSSDGEPAGCASGEELPVSLDFELGRPGENNLNPSFAADAIAFDGATFAEAPDATTPCQGLGLPELAAGSKDHRIEIRLPDAAREPLVQENSADPARESLMVGHFTTAGELSHAFSLIEPSNDSSEVDADYDAPRQAPEGGTLVRFWFVVRDGRGGGDFTSRALCVLP